MLKVEHQESVSGNFTQSNSLIDIYITFSYEIIGQVVFFSFAFFVFISGQAVHLSLHNPIMIYTFRYRLCHKLLNIVIFNFISEMHILPYRKIACYKTRIKSARLGGGKS